MNRRVHLPRAYAYAFGMRFFANGPSIPAHLLEQRLLGNVVFFCGAGISLSAGMPDFGGLTKKLITKLTAEKAQKALADKESFDRVFNVLIGEFGVAEIDREIYRSLRTPAHPKIDRHQIVLDLSRNSAGSAQVVTTNFDLLFECADRRVKRFVPPALPDLGMGQSIDGIVYLHGRLAKPDARARSGYVISSADFGRAYLAEGWAARFVRELRERYTIVLLGYSANDPPMRYLLEGLHTRESASYSSPIYAFASGDAAEMEDEWRDRGVTPLSYEPIDREHSGLWDTLREWAATSRDPDGWNAKVIQLAQQRPSTLLPFERGKVANLVSSKTGAKLFSEATPPPPAEWLCVFDPATRYAKPGSTVSHEVGEDVDPLEHFGLDDDPPRPEPQPNQRVQTTGVNFLGWMFGDPSFPERVQLSGWNSDWSNPLPERLRYLARWMGRIMHEPAAVWWAAGWVALNPSLLWFIKDRLERGDTLSPEVRRFWQLFLEAQIDRPDDPSDFRWFEFENIIKREGWSALALRHFRRATTPYIEFSRPSLHEPKPPTQVDWTDLQPNQVVDMNVRALDRHGSTLPIPADVLPLATAIVRQALEHAAQLLAEIGTRWWRTATLHPSGEPGETYHGRKELFFLWFRDLFLELLAADPDAARTEVASWNANDPFYFGKLTIFALMYPEAASAKEAASRLVRIDDAIFWDSYAQRELLFTLRERWPEFNARERRAIERRIISGPPRWANEKAREYRQRRAAYAASRLRWLELEGCNLTPVTARALPALMEGDPRWTDEWARGADDSLGPRGGMIERITDLRGLDTLPIGEILEAAEERSEDRIRELKDYRPFEGLVASHPLRALSALRRAGRGNSYPVRFWMNLFSDWPEGTPLRLRCLLAQTAAALPKEIAVELRHYIPGWLKKHLGSLAAANRGRALDIFDAVLAAYSGADADATKSGIGTTTVGGVVQDRSEVSFDKAINSPVGKLTETLLSLQGKPSRGSSPPKYIRERLPVLFGLPGDGGGHAVCIVAQRLGWFNYYHGPWVLEDLAPLFSLGNAHSEAAWHGLAYNRNGLSVDLWRALKPALLAVLSGNAEWRLNEHEQRTLSQCLVALSREKKAGKPLISFGEARSVLMQLDDKGRADVLFALGHLSSEEGSWRGFVKPFIENAWPRQLQYRSEVTSRAFVQLLDGMKGDFADAVKTVLPFLRPVPHLNMITHRLTRETGDSQDVVRRFPAATLSLLDVLVADDRSTMPYNLGNVLEMISEAAPSLRSSPTWRRLKDLAG